MGRQKRNISVWVKGSIIEPVVAMVILVMAIAMAFTILTRLNLVPNLQAVNRANEIINQELKKVWQEKDLLDKEETFGGFHLVKTSAFDEKLRIIEIELIIEDQKNKKIAEKTILITERQLFGLEGIKNERQY